MPSILKCTCILSFFLLAVVSGREWDSFEESYTEDQTTLDDYFETPQDEQLIDDPAAEHPQNTQQKEDNSENSRREEDTPQQQEDNSIKVQSGSCACKERVTKALLQSLQSCINVLNAMESCTSRNKRAVEVNMQLMSSCACSDKVNNDLVQSLKSCTDAIVTSSNCKKIYSSCAEIKQNNPNSASGTYEIVVNNRTLTVYCNMGTLCGVGGGWIRLGKFNVTESSTNCPSQLQLVTQSGTRLCSKNVVGCSQPVSIPSQGIRYSQVCGRVRGYQKYSTDGFHKSVNNINAAYLDGVSITRSTGSTRRHIWSFASGFTESETNVNSCPCNSGASASAGPPAFVGNDWYCESGYTSSQQNKFSIADPLWDKKLCRAREAGCCVTPIQPWFRKVIGATISDNLELRLCTNEALGNENVGIDQYEFYVM